MYVTYFSVHLPSPEIPNPLSWILLFLCLFILLNSNIWMLTHELAACLTFKNIQCIQYSCGWVLYKRISQSLFSSLSLSLSLSLSVVDRNEEGMGFVNQLSRNHLLVDVQVCRCSRQAVPIMYLSALYLLCVSLLVKRVGGSSYD